MEDTRSKALFDYISRPEEPEIVRIVYRGVDPEQALQAAWLYETLSSSDGPIGVLAFRLDVVSKCGLSPDSRAFAALTGLESIASLSPEADLIEVFDDLSVPGRAKSAAGRKAFDELVAGAKSSPPWPVWSGPRDAPVFVARGTEGGLSRESVDRIAAKIKARRVIGGPEALWETWTESLTASFVATDWPAALRVALARGTPARAVCGPDPWAFEWPMVETSSAKKKRAWMPVSDQTRRPVSVVRACQCGSYKECHAKGPSGPPCGALDSAQTARAAAFLSGAVGE